MKKRKDSDRIADEIAQDIASAGDEQNVRNISDMEASLTQLNKDSIDQRGKNALDMRTILTNDQINGISQIDTLIRFGGLPIDCAIYTDSIKRLNPSLMGIGRKQITDIAVGRQEMATGGGIFSRIKSAFGMGNPEQ